MPLITQSSIQEVTDRLDAVAIVSDYVKVEKKGGRFFACCPFHQEKTASFTVNPDMKAYYCFGCHKGGSIINFVMEMDKLSFPEAIELLAKKTSVELKYEITAEGYNSPEEERKKLEKQQLYELYNKIQGTFHHFLLKKPESLAGKDYIISRGLNAGMIEQFKLGYAPADRYWLGKFLIKKGYSRDFLASSGLFSTRHPEISLFSGRIIFPIADRQGRTVAFGGRILPSAEAGSDYGREAPKYINSPELEIYKKRETLYGLDLALPELRKTQTAYIAEGYMDVIALHQAGISNAMAPLGTAFTDEQAKLIKRWAERVVFFFDTDRAGQEAAIKGIYTCRKNGLLCFLVSQENMAAKDLPYTKVPADFKDPADILLNFGPEALHKSAKCFISDFEYLINRAKILYKVNDSAIKNSAGKAKATAFLFPFMDLLDSDVARDSCSEAIADALSLVPSAVASDYSRYLQKKLPVKQTEEANSRKSEGQINSTISLNDEIRTLIVVAVNYISSGENKFFTDFRNNLEISEIDDKYAKEIYIALEECIRNDETGLNELLDRINSAELKNLLMEKCASEEYILNSEKIFADGMKSFKRKYFKRYLNEIVIKIRRCKNSLAEDKENNEESRTEIRDLLEEKMRIDNELYLLEHKT